MAPQEERSSLGKRSLEDIAATQGEHTLFLSRIVEHQNEQSVILSQHTQLLQGIETALQLLTGNILNLRTELLVIKQLVQKEEE